jgi:hypothetical protein
LIHASGRNPSARSIHSHCISGERSYTIHEATSEATIQIADTPIDAYSATRRAILRGIRPTISVAAATPRVAPA